MESPKVLLVSPHKKNILYTVKDKTTMEEVVGSLSMQLKAPRTKFPRLIIFCKQYDECSRMYRLFKYFLKEEFTDPPQAPNLAKYRLVDMYTKCTEGSVKDRSRCVRSFCSPSGVMRIVIATVAFGMGLDCPDVCQIILWGAPSDPESFIQQTGRGGKDGLLTLALLFHAKSDHRWASKEMIDFCEKGDTCRRKQIFSSFDNFSNLQFPCTLCRCCDVCMQKCSCESCSVDKCYIAEAFSCL